MIFITLGSQKFQFNRLLQAVDNLVADGTLTEPVFAQIGYSDYLPQHYSYKAFLDRNEFKAQMDACDLVITHGGTGAIIGAVKRGKKVVAVPRLAKYGEHVDDHQIQLVEAFNKMGIIEACFEVNDINDALVQVRSKEFNAFHSNTNVLLKSIDEYITQNVDLQSSRKKHLAKCPQTNVLMVGNDPSVKGGITSVIVQLLSYDWDAHGIHMSFIPTYIEGNPVRKVLFFAKSLLHIRKQLKRFNPHRPDVVHIHMSYRGSFVRALIIHQMCKCANIPDIVHMHGSEFSKWFSSCPEKKQRQIREFLSEVNRVIVLGDSWKKSIQSIEPDTTIQVVHNSVKIPALDKITQWNNTTFQVLYMGVLIKRKGVSDLLDAVAMLRDANLLGNMRFTVAGTGPEEVLLKDKVKKSNLEDVVHFTGWVNGDDKALLYQESQAFVLPSYNEGLPVAVLEAISYGLPVISTDIGDIQAAVHDGENGIIIAPGDISALADALNRIHQSDNYKKWSLSSRKIAEVFFDENIFFKEINHIYHSVHLMSLENKRK